MKKFRQNIIAAGFIALVIAFFPAQAFCGASGTISGFVVDDETDLGLPGANIVIEGTNFGAMADKHGFYIIYNVPAGQYVLSASVIGYVPMKLMDVVVKTDLNSTIDFELSSRILEVPEQIEIAVPRVQIFRDVLSSTDYFGEETISKTTPSATFHDVLSLVPGYVADHFRGGRHTSVQYLIDGLPATGSVTREPAFMVPNSAIAEMVVQTGGFSAEYGNVTSGVVNLVTKDGRNNVIGTVSLAKEVPLQSDNNYDNASRAEFALGGPLQLGFGGPIIDANYLISGSTFFNDTPFRQRLNDSFASPLFFNYDLNSKLMVSLSKDVFLRTQFLLSNWEWRRYDSRWSDNESALPKRLNKNIRFDISLTHTVSPKMYYQLEFGRMELQRQVFGEVLSNIEPTLQVAADQNVGAVWPGAKEPWEEKLGEDRWYGRLSMVRQIDPVNQLKLGLEANQWNVSLDRSRYLLWPDGSSSEPNFVYTRYDDFFETNPFQVAAYAHHKIELEKFIATIGMRYEVFSPNSEPIAAQMVGAADQDPLFEAAPGIKRYKHTFAPRLGIAIPVGNIEHLSLNYGWFYELPPFYYLYINQEGDLDAFWPILGNVDLEPIRAKAWEITYRRAISDRSSFSITGFYREYENLIDTVPYRLAANAVAGQGNQTVFRYENQASSTIGGFEMAFRHRFGSHFTGGMTYSYLNSSGTASWPESNLLNMSRNGRGVGSIESSLAWDQRQAMTFNFAYQSGSGHIISLLSKVDGPAKAVDWLSNEKTDLGWRHYLDFKATIPAGWLGINVSPFLEIRNLLDEKTVDPDPSGLDFSHPSLRFEEYHGRRILIGVTYE